VTAAVKHQGHAADEIYANVRPVVTENPDLFPALANLDDPKRLCRQGVLTMVDENRPSFARRFWLSLIGARRPWLDAKPKDPAPQAIESDKEA
jgi:hypothetical protein